MSNLNFNQVILAGRLTADPDVRTTPQGKQVLQASIAVNRDRRDGNEQTDFIDFVAWEKRAEFISKYFRKGSAILISGKIQTRIWTDKNDQKRKSVEVLVDDARFVDGKSDTAQNTQKSPVANESTGTSTYIPDAYKAPQFEEMAGDDNDLPF